MVRSRGLLGGQWIEKAGALRPPWAGDNEAFFATCNACKQCLEVCPEGIILADPAGYPIIDYTCGGCSFCGNCAVACTTGALSRERGKPWQRTAEISFSCLSVQGVICRLCEARCDAGAICFRPALGGYALPEVDKDRCTGCGLCLGDCPSQSIDILEAAI